MRLLLLKLIFLLSLSLEAQVELFGIEDQLQYLTFSADGKHVIGFGNSTFEQGKPTIYNFITWDAQTGKEASKLDIIEEVKKAPFGKDKKLSFSSGVSYCSMNKGKTQAGFILNNVINETTGEVYLTLFAIYELATGEIKIITDKKIQVGSFCFSTLDPDILGIVALDNDKVENFAGTYSLTKQAVQKTLFYGKGNFQPIKMDYTKSGKIVASFGSNSVLGGFNLYSKAGELIKKVPLKDHPEQVFEKDNNLMVVCPNSTYIIDTLTFQIKKTLPKIYIEGVNNIKTVASLVTRENNQDGKFIYDLNTNKKIEVAKGNSFHSAISPTENKAVYSTNKGQYDYAKGRYVVSEAEKQKPSAIIYSY
ncbi:MAG: hypothetical protein SFY56_05485 [Bacteroidota bacterium]|nr:hypothetical protein [Bacteroidota bacterium]